jgi:hypothetical protein
MVGRPSKGAASSRAHASRASPRALRPSAPRVSGGRHGTPGAPRLGAIADFPPLRSLQAAELCPVALYGIEAPSTFDPMRVKAKLTPGDRQPWQGQAARLLKGREDQTVRGSNSTCRCNPSVAGASDSAAGSILAGAGQWMGRMERPLYPMRSGAAMNFLQLLSGCRSPPRGKGEQREGGHLDQPQVPRLRAE